MQKVAIDKNFKNSHFYYFLPYPPGDVFIYPVTASFLSEGFGKLKNAQQYLSRWVTLEHSEFYNLFCFPEMSLSVKNGPIFFHLLMFLFL